jgi:hypothetical protein
MPRMDKNAVVKAIAVLVCAGLAAWKGIQMEPDQLAEALAFALGVSQLIPRSGDAPKVAP